MRRRRRHTLGRAVRAAAPDLNGVWRDLSLPPANFLQRDCAGVCMWEDILCALRGTYSTIIRRNNKSKNVLVVIYFCVAQASHTKIADYQRSCPTVIDVLSFNNTFFVYF